jgi:hypothetical protein
VVHVVEEAFDICRYDVPIAPVLKIEGEALDRMLRTSPGPIAVTASVITLLSMIILF